LKVLHTRLSYAKDTVLWIASWNNFVGNKFEQILALGHFKMQHSHILYSFQIVGRFDFFKKKNK
jgi:hypothetical protein